jgi:hypothetical protein
LAFKKRDPSVTGTFRLPWVSNEPCPCNCGKPYGACCGITGRAYKEVTLPRPPGPVTGRATRDCYMSWTNDCVQGLSREHFISDSVLRVVADKHIRSQTHKGASVGWRIVILRLLKGAVMNPRRYELTDFEWSIISPLLPNKP